MANAGFSPWQRLSFNQNVNYTTNLSAILGQSILGGGTEPLRFGAGSDSFYTNSTAVVRLFKGLTATGYFTHRNQTLNGLDYSDSQFGGTVNYNFSTPLFGLLYFGLGMVDTANKVGNQGAGLIANLGANRKFGHWDASADFNYSQNIQTLVAITNSSAYSYGGSIKRRMNSDTFWSASFRGAHSGLVVQEGNGSSSESYSTSLGWKRYSISGNYSQSKGTAVLTSNGTLVAAPLGSLITNDFLYFDARSYGVSLSTTWHRRIYFSGGYANVFSSSIENAFKNANTGERYSARVEYRLRKFSIVGGYGRSSQQLSAIPGGPRVVNSYYLSLSRWFNVF
jgi:hypothetical protein